MDSHDNRDELITRLQKRCADLEDRNADLEQQLEEAKQ
jgi:prefoldin subunit 5